MFRLNSKLSHVFGTEPMHQMQWWLLHFVHNIQRLSFRLLLIVQFLLPYMQIRFKLLRHMQGWVHAINKSTMSENDGSQVHFCSRCFIWYFESAAHWVVWYPQNDLEPGFKKVYWNRFSGQWVDWGRRKSAYARKWDWLKFIFIKDQICADKSIKYSFLQCTFSEGRVTFEIRSVKIDRNRPVSNGHADRSLSRRWGLFYMFSYCDCYRDSKIHLKQVRRGKEEE